MLKVPIAAEVALRVVVMVEVATIGPIKPLSDLTGPLNLVCAMIVPHMRVARQSACRQRQESCLPGWVVLVL